MRLTNPFLLLPTVALLNFASVASSQEVTTASIDGVPMSKEPDHHLVLSNQYVNAYNVEVPPQGSTLLHQHLYDNIFVVLGAADVTNTVEGQTPAHLTPPDTSVNFGRAPYAHLVTNNGTTPFRNVIIEFLQPQGQEKSFYKSVTDALAAAALNADFGKQNTVLETDAVRILGVGLPSNGLWTAPSDGHPRLVLALNDTSSSASSQEKEPPSGAGTLMWYDGSAKDAGIANESDQPARLLVVEFKQPQPQTTAQVQLPATNNGDQENNN